MPRRSSLRHGGSACLALLLGPAAAAAFASKHIRGLSELVDAQELTHASCPNATVPWPRSGGGVTCQAMDSAKNESFDYLLKNMPPWDVTNEGTLKLGILGPTVQLALESRQKYPWAASVPKDLWREYVLPYASVNEDRNDWRELFNEVIGPLVTNLSTASPAADAAQVATALNAQIWSALRPQGAITFRGSQTPMIYDPMSTLAFGYASCTGVSIVFVDALRTAGVPARLVGTPAWQGNASAGNHNWVEIYVGGGAAGSKDGWAFIEGLPAGGGETLTDPCDKWFCNPTHFDGKTETFAARFDRFKNATIYPMSWDLGNRHIPGVNLTQAYNDWCGACGAGAGSTAAAALAE